MNIDINTPQAIATAAAEHAGNLQALTSIAISTPELAQWATDEAKKIRTLKKSLEAEREKATKPLLGVLETIRGWFRGPIAALDGVYAHLTAAVVQYTAAEQARAALALAQATTPAEVAASAAAMVDKPQGMVERRYYSMRIVDPSKVPAEYRIPDEPRLQKLAAAEKEKFAVAGCELVVTTKGVPR